MKRTFVTLFPNLMNFHLLKDVGLIPYTFYKDYNYQSYIVCYQNDSYSYLDTNVNGLKLSFLPKCKFPVLMEYYYIIKSAKKIDVLNLYHLSIHRSLFILFLYKTFNKKGTSFLKMDLDYNGLSDIQRYSKIKILIIKFLLKKVDIVTAESRIISKTLKQIFKRDIIYMPNGYYDLPKANICNKENYFLTVGRLGTEQKSTELLLKAYIEIYEFCNWNLILVGSYTESFYKLVQDTIKLIPSLEQRIILTGEITDKNLLTDIYSKTKVFILPSKWESFGLVAVEAEYYGNYLILSDQIPPVDDIIINPLIGEKFEYGNEKKLAEIMLASTKTNHDYQYIQSKAVSSFNWKNICNKINNLILSEENT